MSRTRNLITASTLALGIAVAGCSSPRPPVTYAPVAYGEVVGGQGRCYYVQDPAEVAALQQAGLCPATWLAYQAPPVWEATYWDWYSSPSYYGTYVPITRRATYTSVTVVSFQSTHTADISRLSKTATYKGSDGKTATATTAKAKFSSGSGSNSGQGGGSLRNSTTGGTTGGAGGTTGGAAKSTTGGTTGGSKTTTKTSTGGTSGGSLRGGHK